MKIKLTGRIDSSNVTAVEAKINEQIAGADSLVIDAAGLDYISSAGLRMILRFKKAIADTKVINCIPEVYDIFDVTGFTEMMEVVKAYREISIDGCEILGEGANGIIYRIDSDTIVKVYKKPDALDEIHNERELARKAFILGIPTAIPYDVVKVGDLYGSVFELLNAKSFSQLLNEGEDADTLVRQSVDILKIIHTRLLNIGDLPSKKMDGVGWAKFCAPYLAENIGAKLIELFGAIPETENTIHGDFHINNIMRQGDENLLIDMDMLSLGHPVLEFAQMYIAYQGYSELDPDDVKRFLNIDSDTATAFWNKTLEYYFEGKDKAFIAETVTKIRIIAYVKMLRRTIRRTPDDNVTIEYCKKQIEKLVPTVEHYHFNKNRGIA